MRSIQLSATFPWMQPHEKPWNPLGVDDVAAMFANAPFKWWVAGGVALELALDKSIRAHTDIDLLILRPDHLAAREFLHDWDCWVADPPGTLRIWPRHEELEPQIHDIWCRKSSRDDWRMQLMLDEVKENRWVSRRNPAISAPLEEITRTSAKGVPYLAPHIQLFYKAKSLRDKDWLDLTVTIESDTTLRVDWLREAIRQTYGAHHPWLHHLSRATVAINRKSP